MFLASLVWLLAVYPSCFGRLFGYAAFFMP